MAVPYTFGSATSAIPLSQLDSNFASTITLGNTAIQLGNTVTILNNMTFANVTISSGSVTITNATVTNANVTTALTLSGGTANGVAYLNGSNVVTTGSALTFDGTNLSVPTGNLRIGTSASSGPYQIFYNASNDAYGTLQMTSTGFQMSADFSSTGGYKPLLFYTNGSEQMRLTSTGLGIGTSSPSYKLDVTGTINSGASNATGYNLAFRTSGITTGRAQTSLTNTSGDLYTGIEGSTAGQTLSGSAAYSAFIGTFTSNPFYLVSAGGIRATLDTSGNLGLGVTPSAWNIGKALQVGSTTSLLNDGSSNTYFGNNFYYNGGFKYTVASAYATAYLATSTGEHRWLTTQSTQGANNAITFTQSMTLDNSGNLLVGNTSTAGAPSAGVQLLGPGYGYTGTVAIGHSSGVGSGAYYASFFYAGAAIGSITQSGTTAVLYNLTSDQRLKTNIVDAESSSALIDAIQVRQYDWKSDGSHQRYGFIAQELVTVAPEAVHQPADPEEMMGVDYSKLVPMLVKEIQSLRKRLATLESK